MHSNYKRRPKSFQANLTPISEANESKNATEKDFKGKTKGKLQKVNVKQTESPPSESSTSTRDSNYNTGLYPKTVVFPL